MVTPTLPEHWAEPRTPGRCHICGHYRLNHKASGATDQKRCAAAVSTPKGLVSCDCTLTADQIERG